MNICLAIHKPTGLKCIKVKSHGGFHQVEKPNELRPNSATDVILWPDFGVCEVCAKTFRINKEGLLYSHGSLIDPPIDKRAEASYGGCEGSWTKPKTIIRGTSWDS